MVTFTLRFYGRFVVAREQKQGVPTGHVKLLAPRMEKQGEVDPHRPVMAAASRSVGLSSGATTLQPTWRTFSTAPGEESQIFHWDLTDATVRVPSSNGVKIHEEQELVDLQALERLANRAAVLDKTNLQPGAKTAAVIGLDGGFVVAKMTSSNEIDFIKESDARKNNLVPINDKRDVANLLTVALQVAGKLQPSANGSIEERAELTLEVSYPSGKGQVTIVAGSAGAIVSFSNLCVCLPAPGAIDLEFARYYDVLTAANPDQLIPFISHAGVQDCDDPTTIAYEGP